MTDAPDLLVTIVAAARKAAEVRQSVLPLSVLQSACTRTPRGDLFAEALRTSPPPRIIAECKRRSPSKGILRPDYDPARIASAYAEAGAAAISVLTEPTFFDGSLDHLRAVRAAVDGPVLRKDFLVTEYQIHEAAAAGADGVLLIAGALDLESLARLIGTSAALGLSPLVEVHDERELEIALQAGAQVIGINSRSLRTLSVDMEVLARLAPMIPREVTAVAESGIRTPGDIARLTTLGYRAFLVGERLVTETDPGDALRTLRES